MTDNKLDIETWIDGNTVQARATLAVDGHVYQLQESEPIDTIVGLSLGDFNPVKLVKKGVKTVKKTVNHAVDVAKSKVVKKIASVGEDVLRSNITTAVLGGVAVAFPPVGAPAMAAQVAAKQALDYYDAGRKVVDAGSKVVKAALKGNVKGATSASLKAAISVAPADVKKLAAEVQAKHKALAPKLAAVKKLETNLTGMLKYGSPDQKRQAKRNIQVLSVVAKAKKAADALDQKAKKTAPAKGLQGTVITVDGKRAFGRFSSGGKLQGIVIANGEVKMGLFSKIAGDVIGARKSEADHAAAEELQLFAVNESTLYPQRQAIEKALTRRLAKGTYRPELAAKAWDHWMLSAAKSYTKQFGSGHYSSIFSAATRRLAAESMEEDTRPELSRNVIAGWTVSGSRVKPIIDERTYSVTGPNGYRRAGLSHAQAVAHAESLAEQMRTAGWRGVARVHYRDGSEVASIKVGGLGDQPHDLALESDHLIKLWEQTHGVTVSGAPGPHQWLTQYIKETGAKGFSSKAFGAWLKAKAHHGGPDAARMAHYSTLVGGRAPRTQSTYASLRLGASR